MVPGQFAEVGVSAMRCIISWIFQSALVGSKDSFDKKHIDRSGTLAWLAWRRPGLSRYRARRQGSQEVVAGSSVLPNKRWLVEVAGAYLQRATFE